MKMCEGKEDLADSLLQYSKLSGDAHIIMEKAVRGIAAKLANLERRVEMLEEKEFEYTGEAS